MRTEVKMAIAFLCGSLEPGRDGVGDYTRRLAGELKRQGHHITVIALNDKYSNETFEDTQEVDGLYLSVLRITAGWSSAKRFSYAKEWLKHFDPDWLSLQFVPYSFHAKGLPIFLASQLKQLSFKGQLHIMFHETWVGAASNESLKLKLLSFLQKVCIKRMVSSLQPSLIHTHLPSYRSRLKSFGLKAESLPLFSNIETLVNTEHVPETHVFRIGFFSQIGEGREMTAFLTRLLKQSALNEQQPELLLIGGREASMCEFRNKLETLEELRGRVKYTGFLSSKELSATLESCNLGISPVPRHGLGKSGSVAAFIAHGVPVAAPNTHPGYHATDIGFFSSKLCAAVLLEPDIQKLKKAKEAARKVRKEIEVSTIANKMLSDMQKYYYD